MGNMAHVLYAATGASRPLRQYDGNMPTPGLPLRSATHLPETTSQSFTVKSLEQVAKSFWPSSSRAKFRLSASLVWPQKRVIVVLLARSTRRESPSPAELKYFVPSLDITSEEMYPSCSTIFFFSASLPD